MSLWDDDRTEGAWPSFFEKVPDPGTDPEVGPFVCVQFNAAWQQIVCGCLLQACQPSAWSNLDDAQLADVLDRATKLINLFGFAGACPVRQEGVLTITIPAGAASASQALLFTPAFSALPRIDVSCDNQDIVATWGSVTVNGCEITITAAVPVIIDTSADVSWSADGS